MARCSKGVVLAVFSILLWITVSRGESEGEDRIPSQEELVVLLESLETSYLDISAEVKTDHRTSRAFLDLVGSPVVNRVPQGGRWMVAGEMQRYEVDMQYGETSAREIWSYDGQRTYVQYDRTRYGMIGDPDLRKVQQTPSLLLGNTEYRTLSSWLADSELQGARYLDGDLEIRFRELRDGRPDGRDFRVVLSMEHGGRPREIEVHGSSGVLLQRVEVTAFREVPPESGRFLPVRGRLVQYYRGPDGEAFEGHRVDFEVEDIEVDRGLEAADFRIDFPEDYLVSNQLGGEVQNAEPKNVRRMMETVRTISEERSREAGRERHESETPSAVGSAARDAESGESGGGRLIGLLLIVVALLAGLTFLLATRRTTSR